MKHSPSVWVSTLEGSSGSHQTQPSRKLPPRTLMAHLAAQPSCSSYTAIAVIKYPDKNQWEERVCLACNCGSVTMGKSRQDLKMVSHTTPTVKRRETDACILAGLS